MLIKKLNSVYFFLSEEFWIFIGYKKLKIKGIQTLKKLKISLK